MPEPDAYPAASTGSMASPSEPKAQTCGADDICQGAPEMRLSLDFDKLPEDMLHHIHSLMEVQDAGRAACVSRRFLRSWRFYSNLTLNKKTLGLTGDDSEGSEIRFINKIDKILNNYSRNGMKVKTLKIVIFRCKSVSASHVDQWLRIAAKSGINELSLLLPNHMKDTYWFPYSVLFDETTTSPIQSLYLSRCIFHPIETLGCFGRLKSLDLIHVLISEEGLQQLLSKSSGLERLQIHTCSRIISLKIPCTLQKLKFLTVIALLKMQVVQIGAPNLSSFHYHGCPVEISISDPSQLKDVYLYGILSYGCAKFLSTARNVESLTLLSRGENVNTPVLAGKFLHLKSLKITLNKKGCSPVYDIFSVISFLDASPVLESFSLHAERDVVIRDCVAVNDLFLKEESAYQHDRLKWVKITGFHSSKSLIKLVIHILESAPSLEALTLDTTNGYGRQPGDTSKCTASRENGRCCWMSEIYLKGADEAMKAAGRYITGRVPSAVDFNVLEPCRLCYTPSVRKKMSDALALAKLCWSKTGP